MLLQSFPQFPRLPAELRSNIWGLALRQPRVHRLRIGEGSTEQRFTLQPTETLPRSTITTRTILATCRESRMEALLALPDVLPLGQSILRFNAHEDVICLVKLNLSMLAAVNRAAAAYRVEVHSDMRGENMAGMENTLKWLRKVKSLAFEVRETSMDTGFGFSLEGGMSQLIQFISIFAGLEWLFLVAMPSPDDMKTVKCWTSRRSADHLKETAQYAANDDNGDNDDDDDDEEYESEEDGSDLSQTPGGRIGCIRGNWTRGENGLSDWYCWVPRRTKWKHSNENVEVHFIEMSMCKNTIRNALRQDIARLDFSVDERHALQSLQVQVMIHFREGVEPLHDL